MNHFVFFVPLLVVLTVVIPALALEFRRFRSRSPADQKSIALLRSWLTPDQLNQWDARKEFEVIGGDTGTRYRIMAPRIGADAEAARLYALRPVAVATRAK
jgi:hypothetical protein